MWEIVLNFVAFLENLNFTEPVFKPRPVVLGQLRSSLNLGIKALNRKEFQFERFSPFIMFIGFDFTFTLLMVVYCT